MFSMSALRILSAYAQVWLFTDGWIQERMMTHVLVQLGELAAALPHDVVMDFSFSDETHADLQGQQRLFSKKSPTQEAHGDS